MTRAGSPAPDLEHNKPRLDLIIEVIGKPGYGTGRHRGQVIDAAATEFYDGAHQFEGKPQSLQR